MADDLRMNDESAEGRKQFASGGTAERHGLLTAGTGRCDISPSPGTPQGGWGAQTHQRGTGCDMPLYATALVMSAGDTQVAIVDVDSIGFDLEWTTKIINAIIHLTGIPRGHIRVSSTHTHSGPNTFRLPVITEGLEMVLSYLESLPHRIAGAVWQAQQAQNAVRVAAANGRCEINVNRRAKMPDGRIFVGRNWEGPVDHTVRIVRFDDLDERPVATLLHYACHPTIMGWQNRYVTPDYPGMARAVIEEQVGGTCLFLQGAAGNIGPRRGFTGDLDVYRRLGKILGLEGAKIATSLESLPRRERLIGTLESGAGIALYDDEATVSEHSGLSVRSKLLQLPLREFPKPAELEAEAEELRRELNNLRETGSEEEIRRATARATQTGIRAEQCRLYHNRRSIDWQMQSIRIGQVVLLSIPGEPFTEINERIVAGSPFPHTLFSGYSNGGFGYVPVSCAFEEGGYEVNVSPFAPAAADVIVTEGLALLTELAAKNPVLS
jgi:hypothetical protein